MSVQLPLMSKWTFKDQLKADKANKFIGQGSSRSSTNAYRQAYGDKANCGTYTDTDVVFISAEGRRAQRLDPPYPEISKAAHSGATLLTDEEKHRNRPYNIGERQVADFLRAIDCTEIAPGVWKLLHWKDL